MSLSLLPSFPKIILSAYAPKIKLVTTFSTPGRTKQSFKAECDINNIMARFLKSGVLEFTQKNEPRYGDVTGIEYNDAMITVASAKTLFNELPAALRARFENEPARFLDFVNDDRNLEEAREMGLLKPKAQPAAEEPVPSTTLAPAAPAGPTVTPATTAAKPSEPPRGA